jgi:hypothetical protein
VIAWVIIGLEVIVVLLARFLGWLNHRLHDGR